jgi:hypothetical protein
VRKSGKLKKFFVHQFGFAAYIGLLLLQETANEISIEESGIAKASIQRRANQLTRELHAFEETFEVMQLVGQRRSKSLSKPLSLPVPITLPESPGIQSGIQAFLAAGNELSFSPEKEVVVLSDEFSDVEVLSSFSPLAKRKDEGKSPGTPSPEKKIRTA